MKNWFLKSCLVLFALMVSIAPARADIASDIASASTSLTGYANSIATLVVALAVVVGGALFVRGLIKRV